MPQKKNQRTQHAGGILMTATDMNHGPHHGTPSLSEATS